LHTLSANREDVLATGLGTFCVQDKGKGRGRDPQGGKSLVRTERCVVWRGEFFI